MWSTGRKEDRILRANWHLNLKLMGFSDKSFLGNFFSGGPFNFVVPNWACNICERMYQIYTLSFLRGKGEGALSYTQRSFKCIKNWFIH